MQKGAVVANKRKINAECVLSGDKELWQELSRRILRVSNRGCYALLCISRDLDAWVVPLEVGADPSEIVGCYWGEVSIIDLREAANQHLVDLGVLPESLRMGSVPDRYQRSRPRAAA